MSSQKYISTTEYAEAHSISRMHVNRLIKAGKIEAKKIGRNWMIPEKTASRGLEKTTSLQKWNKTINETLDKNLEIEESKDREFIYAKLNGLGLPHERCMAFPLDSFPTKNVFDSAVDRLGTPYWISCVPNPKKRHLNRLSKLQIMEKKLGWDFINSIDEKEEYKIIVSQYPKDILFKGTILLSKTGHGVAEFITGDRHYIMSRGFTMTDPMLFDGEEIFRYSNTITKPKQKRLFNMLKGLHGHLELQYGKIDGNTGITFFDFTETEAYVEIDDIWLDLVNYFSKKHKKTKNTVHGMPASLGKAKGKCVVLHHETFALKNDVKKGDIIISDTTTPDMTPLMGKAAAIVTDLGGVTSHAAIVCRELGIPAIVGTENATATFRTGDIVSVNAHKGEIKLVKKK
jgi:excisionase family DNA binding protein